MCKIKHKITPSQLKAHLSSLSNKSRPEIRSTRLLLIPFLIAMTCKCNGVELPARFLASCLDKWWLYASLLQFWHGHLGAHTGSRKKGKERTRKFVFSASSKCLQEGLCVSIPLMHSFPKCITKVGSLLFLHILAHQQTSLCLSEGSYFLLAVKITVHLSPFHTPL